MSPVCLKLSFTANPFLCCPTSFLFLFFFAACDFSKCPWKQLTKGRQLPHQISICNNYLEEAVLEIRLDLAFSCVNSSTNHMLMTTPEGMFFALGQLLSCVYLCCNCNSFVFYRSFTDCESLLIFFTQQHPEKGGIGLIVPLQLSYDIVRHSMFKANGGSRWIRKKRSTNDHWQIRRCYPPLELALRGGV